MQHQIEWISKSCNLLDPVSPTFDDYFVILVNTSFAAHFSRIKRWTELLNFLYFCYCTWICNHPSSPNANQQEIFLNDYMLSKSKFWDNEWREKIELNISAYGVKSQIIGAESWAQFTVIIRRIIHHWLCLITRAMYDFHAWCVRKPCRWHRNCVRCYHYL